MYAIIATGAYMLTTAMQIIEQLCELGYSPMLFSAHTLKPFDEATVINLIDKNVPIITMEEHVAGGLASIVSMIIAKSSKPVKFLPVYITNENYNIVSFSADYMLNSLMDMDTIIERIQKLIKPSGKSSFIFSKSYGFNKRKRLVTSYRLLNIPILELEARNKNKKGKLRNKISILGVRVL